MDEKMRLELQQLLNNLTNHFMNIHEYRSAIIAGLIPKMKISEDDLKAAHELVYLNQTCCDVPENVHCHLVRQTTATDLYRILCSLFYNKKNPSPRLPSDP